MRTGELTLPLPSCGAWERGLHILQEFWVSQPNVSVAKLALPLISHVLAWMWLVLHHLQQAGGDLALGSRELESSSWPSPVAALKSVGPAPLWAAR